MKSHILVLYVCLWTHREKIIWERNVRCCDRWEGGRVGRGTQWDINCYNHELINFIDIKAKCLHLKNWSVKGLCGRCLSEFRGWRYIQSCWYFRPRFVNCCPSNLLFGLTGGGGCWVLLETIFCRSSTLCIWRHLTNLDQPKQKHRRGGGLRLIHLPQSPFTNQFFIWRHCALVST